MRQLVLVMLSGCLAGGCLVGEVGPSAAPPPAGGDDTGDPPPDPGDPTNPTPPDPQARGVVVGYAGGTSIAIRWTAIDGASSYTIERDGARIATQTPGFHANFPEVDGNGVIDRDVTPGFAYAYRVLASDGSLVGSTTVTLSPNTTPAPNLTIDTSRGGRVRRERPPRRTSRSIPRARPILHRGCRTR